MSTDAPPVSGTAGPADTGRSCPYCGQVPTAGTPITSCGVCGFTHHADCWSENRGCAVVACQGGPDGSSGAPRVPVAPAPPLPPPVSRPLGQSPPPQPAPPTGPGGPPPSFPPPPPPPPPPIASGSGSGRSWLLLALGIVLAVLLIAGGTFALVNRSGSDGDGGTPFANTEGNAEGYEDPGDSGYGSDVAGEPELDDVPPPPWDRSRAERKSEIKELIVDWHDAAGAGDIDYMWQNLSREKRRQIRDDEYGAIMATGNPGPFDKWKEGQEGFIGELDTSGTRIQILDEDRRENEVTIRVTGMYHSGSEGESCGGRWEGVTWARFERGSWFYEPGYATYDDRYERWADRAGRTLGQRCQ